MITLGSKVIARFPDSAFRLGGTVVMIVQQQDKAPEYEVQFLDGSISRFAATNVEEIIL